MNYTATYEEILGIIFLWIQENSTFYPFTKCKGDVVYLCCNLKKKY